MRGENPTIAIDQKRERVDSIQHALRFSPVRRLFQMSTHSTVLFHKKDDFFMDNHNIGESSCSDCKSAHVQPSRSPIQPLSVEQLRQLLTAAQGDPMNVLFFVAGTTGMRRGEVLALKWQDIDVDQQTILVHRSLLLQQALNSIEAEPKRAQDRRKIRLTPMAVAALKQHLAYQNDLRVQAGDSWQDHGFVFCTSLGAPLHASKVAAAYKAILRNAGLPERRFHDLRYSAAHILLGIGTHPNVVREILGLRQQESSVITPLSSGALLMLTHEAILRLNHALQE